MFQDNPPAQFTASTTTHVPGELLNSTCTLPLNELVSCVQNVPANINYRKQPQHSPWAVKFTDFREKGFGYIVSMGYKTCSQYSPPPKQ